MFWARKLSSSCATCSSVSLSFFLALPRVASPTSSSTSLLQCTVLALLLCCREVAVVPPLMLSGPFLFLCAAAFSSGLKSMGLVKKKIFTVGVASIIWSIWKARNLACFQGKWPSEPSVVLFRVSFGINDLSVVQGKEDAKLGLQQCAKLLERVATKIFHAKKSWASWVPRLEDG